MILEKVKQHFINRIKIITIPIYFLIDFIMWNAGLFFIYDKVPSIYGVKIILSIVSFIFFFKYLRTFRSSNNIRFSLRIISAFFIISLLGSVIEVLLYLIFNKPFLYVTIIALFYATINSVFLICTFIFILKLFSSNFKLEENIKVFYVPIFIKLGSVVYLFFSSILIIFLLHYVAINESYYISTSSNDIINEILNISDDITTFNNNIKSDMLSYAELVINMYSNRNSIDRNYFQDRFNDRVPYVSRKLKNVYDRISVSINKEYLNTGLPYSITLSKNPNTYKYISRTSDALIIHNFLDNAIVNNNVALDINLSDRNNIFVSSYFHLRYFGKDLGYIIADSDLSYINDIIKNNDLLSKWSYIYYGLVSRDIILSSDSRYIAESSSEIFSASLELTKNVEVFENTLNTKIFELFPIVDISGNKSIVIATYIKDLDVVALYYKDLNSIIDYSKIDSSIFNYVFVFISLFIIFFCIYLLIVKLLLSPIKRANISTKRLLGSNGDLRNRILLNNNDEIGILIYNFNLFLSSLDNVIGNLKLESYKVFDEIKVIEKVIDENTNRINDQSTSITESVASINNIITSIQNVANSTEQQRHAFSSASIAVEELLQTIYKINDNMERQSSAVEQTSASIEEMISNITSVAKSVNKADSFSNKLLINAHDGGDTVDEVIEAVRGIEESSDQIKEIVNVIQGIAEQTNLLAMNAAIEAAHAGEQGRGFSVVADEIRSLAEHTADNTKSITNIIKAITKRIEETVELASNSGKSLDNILDMSENTARVVSEINTANSELEVGGRDILETIRHLNNITTGVKDSVKEQMNSGDVVDSQITLLDQITREVSDIIEANSSGAKEIIHAMTFLNELSVKTVEGNKEFYNATSKLNDIFVKFNDLMGRFVTNVDVADDNKKSNDYKDSKDNFSVDERMDMELKNLEGELKNGDDAFQKDDEVLNMLKDDFKNPEMFSM